MEKNPPRPLASERVEGVTDHPIPNPGEDLPLPYPSPVAWDLPLVANSISIGTLFFLIWGFPKAFFRFFVWCKILHRKNDEKSVKIEVFGVPKPSRNPPEIRPKIDVPKNMQILEVF